MTYKEACKKWMKHCTEKEEVKPLKLQYRAELIAELEQEKRSEETEKTVTKYVHNKLYFI